MEKIQIQFKESDYKVYYSYCERYYQIHDAVRKRSVQAFLDLFVKGVLPVEEQDIKQARLILSQRCSDLKMGQENIRGEDDPTMLLQVRACSDILLFCDDLEKIYRLLQKQGLVKNYLIILGTFSRVVEEAKNSDISAMYNLSSEDIEALAAPLAEIIRENLGTDRQWRSVLRELASTAVRYNRRSTGPEFDLDILKLISPAVIDHFNRDVETHEILSVLPSYFKDSELDEFEALLSRAPDIEPADTGADTNWEKISGPLNVIATIIATQREQWSHDRAGSPDQDSLELPSGFIAPGGDASHAVSTSFSGMPATNASRVFDIDVSTDGTTHVSSTIKAYAPPDAGTVSKAGSSPYIPIIIGVSVILLFILGTLIVTGNWHFMGAGNSTNSTPLKNTTVIKNTTVTKATTTKPVATATATVVSKATTIVATPTKQTAYSSADIGNHLIEIAFGPDNSVISKPRKDLVAISISGSNTDDDLDLVQNFIGQFNNLSSTTKIASNIELVGKGDIQLIFMPGSSLSQINTDNNASVYKDVSSGDVYFIKLDEGNTKKIYIDSDLNGNTRDRWILRAILLNMGFYGETAKYPDSVFYSGDNSVSKLSYIDLKAIQLMYGQKIVNGMTRVTVKNTVQ
jgi:hypothetical protein